MIWAEVRVIWAEVRIIKENKVPRVFLDILVLHQNSSSTSLTNTTSGPALVSLGRVNSCCFPSVLMCLSRLYYFDLHPPHCGNPLLIKRGFQLILQFSCWQKWHEVLSASMLSPETPQQLTNFFSEIMQGANWSVCVYLVWGPLHVYQGKWQTASSFSFHGQGYDLN